MEIYSEYSTKRSPCNYFGRFLCSHLLSLSVQVVCTRLDEDVPKYCVINLYDMLIQVFSHSIAFISAVDG